MRVVAEKDPRIDAYIERAAPFAQPILKHIRRVVHLGCPEVVETIKWKMPHFVYKGPMCGMAAFTRHCSFGFWKHSLVLGDETEEREGMGSFGYIASLKELPPEKKLIGYVRKAAELNDAGVKSPTRSKPRRQAVALDLPDDFAGALKKNKKAEKTFAGFSPSQRNEYVEWITEAKRDVTRQRRIDTALEWLSEGKSRNWKYAPK